MTRTPIACLVATLAALPGAASDDALRRRSLEQKAALVGTVVEDRSLAGRVATGASDEARQLLAAAAESRRRGLVLVADGRYEEGEAALDQAIAYASRARRLVPDPARRAADLRERYAARVESAGALLVSARRHAPPGGEPGLQPLARGEEQLARAAHLARAERFDEALAALEAAERSLLEALGASLAGRTLDYTPRFETPEEEWRHELARHGSLRALVPVALAALAPAPPQRTRVDDCVRQAAVLLDHGLARFRAGETQGALAALREATEWLQRAFSAAGLVVPAAEPRPPYS